MSQRSADSGPSSPSTPGNDDAIRRALTRLEAEIDLHEGFGRDAHVSTTVLVDGLRCRSREDQHRIDIDLPVGLGGSGADPTPGVLLRAALGSCLAFGYRLRAARRGVVLHSIRVVVESESDIAGMLCTQSASRPGFSRIHYHVEIESDAPAEVVESIVGEADRLSPILDAVRSANHLTRSLAVAECAR